MNGGLLHGILDHRVFGIVSRRRNGSGHGCLDQDGVDVVEMKMMMMMM